VDHGVQVIQSHDDARYEANGLIWAQGSLGSWNPDLVKKTFACAVSLPSTTAGRVLCVLCANNIPLSDLDSDDGELGLESTHTLAEALGKPLFVQVYSNIHTYLSAFVDSEVPVSSQETDSSGSSEFETGIWMLLGLVRHPWVSSKAAQDGWNLLFEVSASSNWATVSKRIFQTYLEDASISLHNGTTKVSRTRARRDTSSIST
jgi:hypothetical protein